MRRTVTVVFLSFRIVLDLVSVLVVGLQFVLLSPYREQYLEYRTFALDDSAIGLGIFLCGFFLFVQLCKAALVKGVFGQRVTYWDLFLILLFLCYLGYWLHFRFSDAATHYS
jgi:hypothetical protein